jgi:hypothetical protein
MIFQFHFCIWADFQDSQNLFAQYVILFDVPLFQFQLVSLEFQFSNHSHINHVLKSILLLLELQLEVIHQLAHSHLQNTVCPYPGKVGVAGVGNHVVQKDQV